MAPGGGPPDDMAGGDMEARMSAMEERMAAMEDQMMSAAVASLDALPVGISQYS